jgi:hypothetical protein
LGSSQNILTFLKRNKFLYLLNKVIFSKKKHLHSRINPNRFASKYIVLFLKLNIKAKKLPVV